MDAFTDIGWFLYISLDSWRSPYFVNILVPCSSKIDSKIYSKVWMHLQTFYQKSTLASMVKSSH